MRRRFKPSARGVSHNYGHFALWEVDMRLASAAIFGSLLINTAFGVVVAGGISTARPVVATALRQCSHHASATTAHHPVDGHYLAAVRMGWTVS